MSERKESKMNKYLPKFLTLGLIFVSGLVVQSYTNFGTEWLSRTPRVYSKPEWYTVTRDKTTLHYKAEGERYIECTHKAPLVADFLDKFGLVVARELIRRGSKPDVKIFDNAPNIPLNTNVGDVIGTPVINPNPQKLKINRFFIVTDEKTLEESINFRVKAECFNTKDGRVTGYFGEFPIPKDGDTIGYFPDVSKQPLLTNTLPRPLGLR